MTGILDVPAPLQDCDGLIDPSAFPIPTTDHVELRNQASALRKAGKGVAETGEDIVSTWGGLSACYTAPESEDLLGALAPVSAKGSDVESGTDRAAGALEDFADEVREIKMEWNDLRNRAAAFRERMLSEEDWKKSDHWFTSTSSNVEKSNAYRDEALALIKWYERAQRICANTISRGIVGRTVFVRGSSSQATTNPDAFVFDTIDTDADIPSVWGEPGTADQYWHQDALDAVWDFGVDAVQGTGAMLGMHSSEGWFEMSWGDALKEYHWDNLTSAASLIGMYDAETDSLGWSGTDTIHGAWRDLAHSVVPWEEWGDRPGYVIGTAALNVVGLVGGAALTATGVGAVVGVPLMAWRGMSIVDGMGGSGSRGGSGDGVETNISSPSMNLPNFGGNGSPVANLNFDSSDLSGFDPRQVSEIGASLERLYNSQQSGGTGSGEAAGGGRPTPSRPIGQDRSETSGQERRPAEDPRVDDMLTFEDIVNHPDNATLGDRLRTENQRALDQVDRDNKTRSNDTPASDEGTWTAREIIDGPEGDRSRVLTPAGGGHNDTFDASAANRPPSSPLHARADGIDGTGSGRGPGNEASDNNRGGDHGANMSDRSPTAHNQDGTGHRASSHGEEKIGPPTSPESADRANGSTPPSTRTSGDSPGSGNGDAPHSPDISNPLDPDLGKKLEKADKLENRLRDAMSDEAILKLRGENPRDGDQWQRLATTVNADLIGGSKVDKILHPKAVEFALEGSSNPRQFAYRYEYYKATFNETVENAMESQKITKKQARQPVKDMMIENHDLLETRMAADREVVLNERGTTTTRVDPNQPLKNLVQEVREEAGNISMGDPNSTAYHARKHYKELPESEITIPPTGRGIAAEFSQRSVKDYLDSLEATLQSGKLIEESISEDGSRRMVFERSTDKNGDILKDPNDKQYTIKARLIVAPDGRVLVPTFGRM
ncbi:hypothetical protein ACFYOC_00200 [Nocardiopsis alba]|uniref:hypothetical protein n=1 Tax=Nocardiopsis alba TaxID=53437 RepID=UPI00069471EC|nr:hypothetical protein [Nocardiopsis alba]